MPWEISVALAAAALFALVAVATMTLAEMRRAGRNVTELNATLERHLPAILQNLDEINRNANALKSSIQALSDRAAETGKGFERVTGDIHAAAQSLEESLIAPVLKTVKGVSTLFAFGAALRGLRHPLRLWLWGGKGRA
jgi:methyl-accepting chemotaxis protein